MTNWEHDKENFLKMAACSSGFAVDKRANEVRKCRNMSCNECLFRLENGSCSDDDRMKWLDEEYAEPKKPEIDWSKVPVDTPVIATWRGAKLNEHFAKYKDGKIYTWSMGATSWSMKDQEERTVPWDHAEIAPGIDCSKWYKE